MRFFPPVSPVCLLTCPFSLPCSSGRKAKGGKSKQTLYKNYASGRHPLHESKKVAMPPLIQIQNPTDPSADHLGISLRSLSDPARMGRYVKYAGHESSAAGIADNTRDLMRQNNIPIRSVQEKLKFSVYFPSAAARKDTDFALRVSEGSHLSRRAWQKGDMGDYVGELVCIYIYIYICT